MTDSERSAQFETLFRATAPQVLAFARRRVNRTAADDVLAETYLAAWRRLDELPTELLPWLYGAARRVIANQRRASARQTALAVRIGESSVPSDAEDGGGEVLAALSRLSHSDQDTLTLTAWEGLDGRQAALAFGCSYGAFRIRLARARKRLAAELANNNAPTRHAADSPTAHAMKPVSKGQS